MNSDSSQELSDEDDILKQFFFFFDSFNDDISTKLFLILIAAGLIVLCLRYVLRWMFTLCSFNQDAIHYMPQRCAIEMVQYVNPFKFQLYPSETSYSGIDCTLHSSKDCYVLPLWGVPIYELIRLLHETSWDSFLQSICDKTFERKCLSSNDHFILYAHKELRKVFTPKSFDSTIIESQPAPRLHYPFVLMMILKEFPTNDLSQVVVSVNVIHIKDQLLKFPTQIMHQFCRSKEGLVATVKNIYPGSFETSKMQNGTVELCLVCLHREIAVVIIPCGHACVCRACFDLCETCPICRGPKNYFFISCTVSQH